MGTTFKRTKVGKAKSSREASVSYTVWDHHIPEREETDEDGDTYTVKGYDIEVVVERYEATKNSKKKDANGYGYGLKVMNWPTDYWKGTNASQVLKHLTAEGVELAPWLHKMASFIDDLCIEQDDDGETAHRDFADIWHTAHRVSEAAMREDEPKPAPVKRRRPKMAGTSKEAS